MIHLRKYIIMLLAGCSMASCNDWLDLEPSNTVTETDLFSEGTGYRNALNGVYSVMASKAMYGQEMSWATVDVLAQLYNVGNYSEGYGTSAYYAAQYQYTNDEVQSLIDKMWEQSYKCIANCNNIIQQIELADSTIFDGGESERKLIQGEALALRASLHFDMLRLFAPAKDDGKRYMPYVDYYPCKFKEYAYNDEILQLITEDLETAKGLVGQFDLQHLQWFSPSIRIENYGFGNPGYPNDVFYAYRAYRMNYYAICGMLARVYLYREMYKEAFDNAQLVIKASTEPDSDYSDWYKCFTFTNSTTDGNNKLYDGVVYCLSNPHMYDVYEAYINSGGSGTPPLYLFTSDVRSEWFAGDAEDCRLSLISTTSGKYQLTKHQNPGSGNNAKYCEDMIPMIRLSEMYLVCAEYYNDLGDVPNTLAQFRTIREGRNCTSGNIIQTSEPDWFKKALIEEARREFMGEGQLFYYYKRLNVMPYGGKSNGYEYGMTKPEQFVLPYPSTEIL